MATCSHVNCSLLMLCYLFCISWNSRPTRLTHTREQAWKGTVYICVALPSTQLSLGPTRSGVWSRTPGSTWQTCVLGPSLSPILAAPHSNLPLPRAHDKFWPCKTPKVALAVSWFGDWVSITRIHLTGGTAVAGWPVVTPRDHASQWPFFVPNKKKST